MKSTTRDFKRAAAAAVDDMQVRANLDGLYRGFHQAREQAAADTPDWESMRDRAREVKAHTLDNLDHYLEMAERNVLAAGGNVFFAGDAEAAARYVLDLARDRGVRVAIKSKSMLSEEMGLNEFLTKEGIEPVETDLGEYIIQLADETPFHIIAPAIHKSREEVSTLFQENLARDRGVRVAIKSKSMLSEEMGLNEFLTKEGVEPVETDLGEYIIQLADETPFHIIAPAIHKSREEVSTLFQEKHGTRRHEDIEDLTAEARDQLRGKFVQADMGITGANFVVAETGTVVLVTNEGNGRMCTSMPRIHVAIMGMERIVPSMEDMGMFLRLLIRSATGQRISSYVTTVTGPRATDAEDGPDEFHLVVVDNGRSRLLADPELREALFCIRCGACLNACPVYRKVGGHAYGWVYPGPIGAVVSPMLTDLSDARDLPYASTLCGNCREVCPVRIDIPRMLLHLRKELTSGETYPEARSAPLSEKLAMKLWRIAVGSPLAMRAANVLGRLALAPLRRGGRVPRLPGPLSGWTRHRDFPALAARPFRTRWRKQR